MKQLAFLLAKIFIFSAVIVGASLSIPYILLYFISSASNVASGKELHLLGVLGWGAFLLSPIVFGVLFGILMALTLGLSHYFMVRRIAQGKPFDLSPIQHRSLILKSNSMAILENCVLVLQKFPARIIENNTMKNYITARTGTSWKSWGDDIRIDLINIDTINTQLKITCRPSLKTTLVDYGNNFENAEKLLSLISKSL